ncbi:hypothetical protein GCM10011505_42640 [Tistrella bauzanensis]|uniref:HTH marR-type domain-containing protein n=1 Tax=Tistrella bauzanensis TaxID=657419 RepID=A0ABQ1J172_9PROT|nr:MarR family transcriptional regulator [Tistrella bauzanensis]GGB57221.1 hypothetical protein GCM10011505_42640 [Tistrella bauzanensis]
MPVPASDTPLRGHLGYWLRLVSNHVSQSFARALATRDIGVADWVILRMLHEAGPAMPSRLAADLGMTRGGLSKLADRLVARGLIVRTGATADKRRQLLALTDAGRRLIPDLTALADANDAAFFGDLPVADRQVMERVLTGIASRHHLTTVPSD